MIPGFVLRAGWRSLAPTMIRETPDHLGGTSSTSFPARPPNYRDWLPESVPGLVTRNGGSLDVMSLMSLSQVATRSWQRLDSNRRPPGYEPGELTKLLHSAMAKNRPRACGPVPHC